MFVNIFQRFNKNALLAAALSACVYGGVAQAQTKLKAGHITAVEHPWHQALEGFAQDVYDGTNGEIEIQIYPNSQLGGEREMAQGLNLGVLEMGLFGRSEERRVGRE